MQNVLQMLLKQPCTYFTHVRFWSSEGILSPGDTVRGLPEGILCIVAIDT